MTKKLLPWSIALLLLVSGAEGVGRKTIVVWAPGYPGTTEQAQETMDAFARGVERAAGWPEGALGAIYHQTLEGGLAGLAEHDAALALIPSPLLFQYGAELKLEPMLQVVLPAGADEVWSLVAKKGRVPSAASLKRWELVGMAGYAPDFIRGPVLGAWGELPASARIVSTSRVLSALRRAASGEDVAVLLDRTQAGALGALPFADELEVVARSGPLPSTFLCRVGDRLGARESSRLREAMLSLHRTEQGEELLASLRMVRFEPVNRKGLEALRLADRSAIR